MKYLKTEGLVIRSRSYSEADKLLTLFTLERGKVPAIAKGACKAKSKLGASVQMFTRGEFFLYMGRTLATVTQSEIKNSFHSLQYDLVKYAYGQYFCELVGRLMEENEPNREVYELLLAAFEFLSKEIDADILARSFELKLLRILGYMPHLDGCLACSGLNSSYRLSYKEGGILCQSCSIRDPGAFKISLGTLSLLKKLLYADFTRLKVLKVELSQKREIKAINKKFFNHNLGLGTCKSMTFLEELKN
ncbi:MAG: DNA repair protein RecO [Firmicutes bacterium HGW-Firmicutes-13]|nr:MAG: DNA repair protein RecO [Firmicutes bacterium HGW-Firmicutes-13]